MISFLGVLQYINDALGNLLTTYDFTANTYSKTIDEAAKTKLTELQGMVIASVPNENSNQLAVNTNGTNISVNIDQEKKYHAQIKAVQTTLLTISQSLITTTGFFTKSITPSLLMVEIVKINSKIDEKMILVQSNQQMLKIAEAGNKKLSELEEKVADHSVRLQAHNKRLAMHESTWSQYQTALQFAQLMYSSLSLEQKTLLNGKLPLTITTSFKTYEQIPHKLLSNIIPEASYLADFPFIGTKACLTWAMSTKLKAGIAFVMYRLYIKTIEGLSPESNNKHSDEYLIESTRVRPDQFKKYFSAFFLYLILTYNQSWSEISNDPLNPLKRLSELANEVYDLCLIPKDSERERLTLYIDIENTEKKLLKYEVIGPDEKLKTGAISLDVLEGFPQDASSIIQFRNLLLPTLLAETSKVGHTVSELKLNKLAAKIAKLSRLELPDTLPDTSKEDEKLSRKAAGKFGLMFFQHDTRFGKNIDYSTLCNTFYHPTDELPDARAAIEKYCTL